MPTFYLDPVNGNDATTATPLGWWSVPYTGGTTAAPSVGDTITGATSGSTAKLSAITLTSGTWAGNNAAGIMYFYGKSAAFQAEEIGWTGGHADIGADFTYCAWKTIEGGPTAARIAPADIVRMAKSPDPTLVGSCTWTDKNNAVTVPSGLTANIETCETAWTASANVSSAADSTNKREGNNSVYFNVGSGFGTGIIAYKNIANLDLAAFQQVSFWMTTGLDIAAGVLRLDLCSDDAGTTPLASFVINTPLKASSYAWIALTIDLGSALPNDVESVALYAISDPGAVLLRLDNIIACKAPGDDSISLTSLLSKNTAGEGWYPIESINGTTVKLATDRYLAGGNSAWGIGWPYSGATEAAATYKQETSKIAIAAAYNTASNRVQDSGSAGSPITFSGGWNTATNEQDGMTFLDGQEGHGYGLHGNGKTYIAVEHLGLVNFYYGISSFDDFLVLDNVHITGCTDPFESSGADGSIYSNLFINSSNSQRAIFFGNGCVLENIYVKSLRSASSYVSLGYASFIKNIVTNNLRMTGIYTPAGAVTIDTLEAKDNYTYGVRLGGAGAVIKNGVTSGNGTSGIGQFGTTGKNTLINCLISEATEVSGTVNFKDQQIISIKHDQQADNHKIFTDGGSIISNAVTRHTENGIAWEFKPTSANRSANYPLTLSIAKIAVSANNAVDVSVFMRRSNIGITGKLVCRGGQIAGIANDVSTAMTAIADTWEEVSLAAMTPTENGVIEIEVWAYGGTTYSLFVDDLAVTQA